MHLDIKPQKVLVVNNTWKIGDLDGSHGEDAECLHAPITVSHYAVPEINKGEKSVSADLHSYGILLGKIKEGKWSYGVIEPMAIIYCMVWKTLHQKQRTTKAGRAKGPSII